MSYIYFSPPPHRPHRKLVVENKGARGSMETVLRFSQLSLGWLRNVL